MTPGAGAQRPPRLSGVGVVGSVVLEFRRCPREGLMVKRAIASENRKRILYSRVLYGAGCQAVSVPVRRGSGCFPPLAKQSGLPSGVVL